MTGAVARRYARAIFALARDAHALEQTAGQLNRAAALVGDPAIGPTLSSPPLDSAPARICGVAGP